MAGNLKDVIAKLEKSYGKGIVMKLGDKPDNILDVIDTGSLSLNKALGINGYPKGRIIEIYGAESSGKTTMCIHAIANCQKQGGLACIVDAEHAFDPTYAKSLGVNIDNLLISQPSNGEEALEVVDNLVNSGDVSLIIVDSVAALVPKAELEGEMGDSKMGLHARLMSQAMRKLTGAIHNTNTCVIFINQTREKIGIVYGSNITTTGGNGLKFAASVRLEIKKSTQIKDGDEVLGNKTTIKVVKNKVAPPFKIASFDIIYGKGIDNVGEVIDLALEQEIIQQKGAWFKYEGDNISQGRASLNQLLNDNPELYEIIKNKIVL